MVTETTVLVAEDLCLEMNGLKILDQISLNLKRGEIAALIGDNGSGKSSLAQIFAGIRQPSSGQVRVLGRAYLLFQNPDDQIIQTTVYDDVAFSAEQLYLSVEATTELVEESLRETGLWEYRESNPAFLSGGQRQRLAIAGALSARADILLLDEPTSMLDPLARQKIWQLLRQIAAKGRSVLLITHHEDEIRNSDRVLHLIKGKIEHSHS